MKILYLGDIVGENTLIKLQKGIEEFKKEYGVQLVFANVENVSGGKGLIEKNYKELKKMGINAMSMGNHTFSKFDIFNYIDEATIAVPANINTKYGKKVLYIKYNDKTIALVNLLGRVYSSMLLDCPFRTMDNLLSDIKADYIIVDFHGDATSEKKAFFYDFAGRVDVVVGSHTHTQTNDAQVYNNTCFITDMGMCGPELSILGDDKDIVIERFRTGVFMPLKVSGDKTISIQGVVIDLSEKRSIIPIKKLI